MPNEGGPGGCFGHEECEAYCSQPSNEVECIQFALQEGHMSPEEAERALRGGPGGCRGHEECDAFCSQPANGDVCIQFAVQEGHMSPEEAERILRGGPGGCRGHEECEAYCRMPEHNVECLQRAVEDGFMTQAEADQITAFMNSGPDFPGPRGLTPGPIGPGPIGPGPVGPHEPDIDVEKALRVIEELGGGPGGCQNLDECDKFCSTPKNDEVCFNFAIEHELMDPVEAEKFKRLSTIPGPGGCIGRECETYCEEPGREQECIDFAHKQGFIDDRKYEEIQRFVNIEGPGGCIGRECERYCNDPVHRDECFEFAISNNLIPPEELKRIKKFRAIEQKVEEHGGPGGCRGEVECRKYCSDVAHFDECAAFAVSEGFMEPNAAENALKQFMQVEEFGPRGFGPGGPGDFGQPGFGPGGPGDFGPPGGFGPGVDEQFQAQFDEEFNRQFDDRFKQFEQFRGQFERGEIPQRMPGDFRDGPGSFPGSGLLDRFRGGEGDFGGPSDESRVMIELQPASGLYKLMITDSDGIKEFVIDPVSGPRYSGGVLNCVKEYKTETSVFGQMTGPFTAKVIDCADNEYTTTIDLLKKGLDEDVPSLTPGDFPREFPGAGEFLPSGEFPGPGMFPGTGEFPTPDEFPGGFPPYVEFEKQFEQEFDRQFQDEFQRQFEEQGGGDLPSDFQSTFPFPVPTSGSFPAFDDGSKGDSDGFQPNYDCSLLDCFEGSYCDPYMGCVKDDFSGGSGNFGGDGVSCGEGYEEDGRGGCIPFGTGDYGFDDSREENFESTGMFDTGGTGVFDAGNTGTFDSDSTFDSNNFMPPHSDTMSPPPTLDSGGIFDSGGMDTFDSGGTFDSGNFMPSPDGNEPPPPTSFRELSNLFANILSFFNPAFC